MNLSKAPEPVVFRPKRSLGGISATVVIEESHSDELEITEHPVEQGASISDHAYKKPAEVTIKAGWVQGDNADSDPAEVYKKLLELQEKREPFDIVTGRRSYSNMLLKSLSVTTDKDTANVLLVNASCREVIIVETHASSVPPRRVHKNPGKTGDIEDKGKKEPSRSVLDIGFGDLLGKK